jgi:hypothetical protein
MRRLMLMVIFKEMAAKDDVERLREELKSYVDARINDLYGVVKTSLVAIVVALASTVLVPLAPRLLLP